MEEGVPGRSQVIVLYKFCQGQPYGGQYLTLTKLLAIKQGDLQKLVVPHSLHH